MPSICAERMAGVQLESVVLSVSAGRARQRIVRRDRRHRGAGRDATATSRACSRPAAVIRCARAAPCCIRCRSAMRSTMRAASAIRAACSAQRFGVDMHVATTDVAAARNLMLAVERCHLAVEAMVASPYVAGLSVLADDEADLGAAVIDIGAGTTTIAVFCRRPLRPCRRLRARRPPRHHGHRARAQRHASPTPSASRPSTAACSSGGSDERDMITVPPVGDDEREPPQFVSRARARAHHPAARRGDSRNGARPARRLAVRGRAARARDPHRRRQPDDRPPELAARILGRPVRIGRPLGIAGLARRGQGTGVRGRRRAAGLPASGPPRTLRTAANAAADDRDRRISRTGRTMASGELLMTPRTTIHARPVADRPATGGGLARPRNERGTHDHQPENPRHPGAQAADHRIRRRRRRRQRRQQHDHRRAAGRRVRRRQYRRAGAHHVEGRAHHPDGRAGHRRPRRRLAARRRPRRGRGGDRRDPRSSRRRAHGVRHRRHGRRHRHRRSAGDRAGRAKELGILTVGVVTKPFHFEGERRMRVAERGITELQKVRRHAARSSRTRTCSGWRTRRPLSPTPSRWPTRCSIRASPASPT